MECIFFGAAPPIPAPSCQTILTRSTNFASSLDELNDYGKGYALLPSSLFFTQRFLVGVRNLEEGKIFPFDNESTYLIKDFDGYDIRNHPEMITPNLVPILNFITLLKSLIEREISNGRETSKWVVSFAEIRVDTKKEKYSIPHLDDAVNDLVAITSFTRSHGTIFWDGDDSTWYEAPVEGNTLIISTEKRTNPTYHQAPIISEGSILIVRFRQIPIDPN